MLPTYSSKKTVVSQGVLGARSIASCDILVRMNIRKFRTKGSMRRKSMKWVRRHTASIIVIAIVLGSCAVFVGYYQLTQSQLEAKARQDAATKADTLKEKTAKVKAQQDADAKAAAAEAAKKAAEESKKTPESSVTASSRNSDTTHSDPARTDVVVNKKHCVQPLAFAPPLQSVGNGFEMSTLAADSFLRMQTDAATAGQPIAVTSAYRSYSTQIITYNYWVSQSGAAGADTYSARPGYSEHQTGLAVDVEGGGNALSNFKNASQYQWMQDNAANYGFIQRYYAGYEAITGYNAEEWHYRYVGTTVALDMKAKGVKTLEQYWNITGGDY